MKKKNCFVKIWLDFIRSCAHHVRMVGAMVAQEQCDYGAMSAIQLALAFLPRASKAAES